MNEDAVALELGKNQALVHASPNIEIRCSFFVLYFQKALILPEKTQSRPLQVANLASPYLFIELLQNLRGINID
jgi:hypothetical protein